MWRKIVWRKSGGVVFVLPADFFMKKESDFYSLSLSVMWDLSSEYNNCTFDLDGIMDLEDLSKVLIPFALRAHGISTFSRSSKSIIPSKSKVQLYIIPFKMVWMIQKV